jgi:uncharacterized protein YbbC (DUF1343 family)/beta-glucosidase-like glycosyl hydrolase
MLSPFSLIRGLLGLALVSLCCVSATSDRAPNQSPPTPDSGGPLSPSAEQWVENTIAGLSLEEKAAQMVMVAVNGHYWNPQSEEFKSIATMVGDLGVGGVVISTSELETLPRLLNDLQASAALPLLVAADLERGMAFRVRRGTVPLPTAMAVGATRSPEAARFTGEVTAREGRALGIHWAFAPVADVNNNPANPVINVRSYGEDPELVASMVEAFIEGVHRGGMLATAKHFPGHGDTSTDSHETRPAVTADRERLAAVELVPFRRAIDASVDAVMLAHVSVPSLDPSNAPATLSPEIGADLLRRELGFEGLIVTDALDMAGVRPAWEGEAVIRAVRAGADVMLMPRDPLVAVQSLVRGVEEGQITESRIDISVRRILEAKASLGLHQQRLVNRSELDRSVGLPEDFERALGVAKASITVARNEGDVLPLVAEEPIRLLHLAVSSGRGGTGLHGPLGEALRDRQVETTTHVFGPEVSAVSAEEVVAAASEHTHVLVSAFVRVSADGSGDLSAGQVDLIQRLHRTGLPVVVVSFGSPYLLAQIPEVPAYVCAYGSPSSSQQAAVAGLFGEFDVRGRLPVTLPGLYPHGHGLDIDRREMTLPRARPSAAGFRADGIAEVEAVLADFLEQRAFPGGVLAIGYRGALVYLKPFGRLSYDDDAPPVTADTIYDLASLTKVVATTTMAMILVDEGSLDLDKPVEDFLPAFQGLGKETISVRDLLTHSSGLQAGGPLYRQIQGREAYLEEIQAMDLEYEPGTKSVYSDFGMILLGEVLERVAGQPLDSFVEERVFRPLRMDDTGFLPPADEIERIAPTEMDPWRGYLVRGEVHDENAFAMGGVAPHAGLFGTAGDLARYAQMILNGGVLEHRRIVSREVVEEFTRRSEIPESERAIGWDTKSAEKSSAGRFFSPRTFGHLGYTGTSMWIDPDRELFLILLTNRVHPTRENILIRQARPAVADAVVQALADPRLPSAGPAVKVGLERLEAGAVDPLRGKRIGLIVHGASVTEDGRHAIDVLRDLDLDLVRLFSPEHGLRGQAAAGEEVASGVDPVSGLPVVSLYGEKRGPDPGDLEDLDVLVFDLQGAGVRFYTYVSTLILSLEAAADAGVEFVVLDRPNPLGGERLEGPVSEPRDVVPSSFVNLSPGPLVHGLTLGEMARFVNAGRENPARLTVVEMNGWTRDMEWADTGRRWFPPSPNLRSADAAIAYPGIAFLEATNVSEGRGTPTPFLVFGAPWMEASAIEVSVPGFELEETSFTPRGSAAAPHPKWADEECRGLRVRISDVAVAEPYRLGVTLVYALSQQPGFEWRQGGEALTRLLGTGRVLRALQDGGSVDEIIAADRSDHEAWRAARQVALLY